MSGGYQLPPYDREHFRDQAVNAILWAGHNAVVFYSGAVNVVSTTSGIMYVVNSDHTVTITTWLQVIVLYISLLSLVPSEATSLNVLAV